MATITQPTRRYGFWRLSVAKYLKMIELGILTERDRVFLWKGVLLEKMTKARPHTVTVMRLFKALDQLVAGRPYYIEKEEAVRPVRRKDTLPEPDLKVVRGRLEDYNAIPTTQDAPLIIEVSDSTLRFYQGPKQRLFAAESVPEYWVVSVTGRWIEVFTQPSGPQTPVGYQSRKTYRLGDSIPVQLDGTLLGHIPLDEVFA
jgi:Uma2 family endonuclease